MHSSIEGEIGESKETKRGRQRRRERERQLKKSLDSISSKNISACPAVIPAQLAVNASAAAALLAVNFTTAPAEGEEQEEVLARLAVNSCDVKGPPSGIAIDMDTAMAAAARMNIKIPPRPPHSIRSCWRSYCCRVSNWQVSEIKIQIQIQRYSCRWQQIPFSVKDRLLRMAKDTIKSCRYKLEFK